VILDLEAADVPDIRTRVCVVGAGAAGITVTRALAAAGIPVALLESGGLDHRADIDALMEGDNRGFPYYPLHECRLRFFGGTTSIWGGRCAELDAIDFAVRPWVTGSGWPIVKADLKPYYDRALTAFELHPMPDDDSFWETHGLERPAFDPAVIRTGLWQFDTEADRFAVARHRDLLESDTVTVVLHANVTGLKATEAGTHIHRVEFANLAGRRGAVVPEVVVLAAGGIENPRLLLASNDVQKTGLGNERDLVGRYFMEHPHARGARIDTERVVEVLKLLPRSYQRDGKRYAVLARPAETLQEREGLLNTSFTISARQHPDDALVIGKKLYTQLKHDLKPNRWNRAAWHLLRRRILAVRETLGPTLGALQASRKGYGIYTVMRAEQAPNPDSRITLSMDTDPLGVPKPVLDWRFLDIDKRSVAGAMRGLGVELARLRYGSVVLDDWLEDPALEWKTDQTISNHPISGYHHMGTTRMGSSPVDGVVDANTKVFGIDNLFVAGSSVFTTSGWANPTLTIVALALRLAEHLGRRLAPGSPRSRGVDEAGQTRP
jgi:choline dehydrogenase-like flavoprotein